MQIRECIYRGEYSTGISWPPAFEEVTSPHIKVASLRKPYQRAKRRGATYRLTRSTEPTKKTKKMEKYKNKYNYIYLRLN